MVVRVLVLLLAFLCSSIVPSSADTLTFKLRSKFQYKVQVSFYSQARNHEWPGGGQAYDLDDWDEHTFRLSCRSGEKICYGAWVTGNGRRYWGVGPDDKHGCSDCCAVCGAGTVKSVDLIP